MLTKADVSDLIARVGLADKTDQVMTLIRPGWRLEFAEGRGLTHLGGVPSLAPDERWPLNERGIPMTFLAQVDCSTLPELPAEWAEDLVWGHAGQLLRIFADHIDQPDGEAAVVVLGCPPDVTLELAAQPPVPDPFPEGGPSDWADAEMRYFTVPHVTVTPVAMLTASQIHPDIPAPEGHFEHPALLELDDKLRMAGVPPHTDHRYAETRSWSMTHLAGHAYPTHDDPRFYLAGGREHLETWCTLIAIHDTPGFIAVGELGSFAVYLPVSDLANGDYQRARSIIEMA